MDPHRLRSKVELGVILSLSFTCCGISGLFLTLTDLSFPYLLRGDPISFAELWGLNEIMSIKYLIHNSRSINYSLFGPASSRKSCHLDPKNIILMQSYCFEASKGQNENNNTSVFPSKVKWLESLGCEHKDMPFWIMGSQKGGVKLFCDLRLPSAWISRTSYSVEALCW